MTDALTRLTELDSTIEDLKAKQAKAAAIHEAAKARQTEVLHSLAEEFQILNAYELGARLRELEAQLEAELTAVEAALRRSTGELDPG